MEARIGYAPGVFDLFHIGHLNVLRNARARCDYLIAGVVSDDMCRVAKGHNPVIPLVERLEIVSSVKYVDRAIEEYLPEKLDTWQEVGFNVIFKGDDWRGTARGAKLELDFARVGVAVVYLPYTIHTSSSLLRRALHVLDSSRPSLASAQ